MNQISCILALITILHILGTSSIRFNEPIWSYIRKSKQAPMIRFSRRDKFVPLLDDCTKGSTYCEKVDNYPYQHVSSILKRTNAFEQSFGADPIVPDEIVSRFSGIDEIDEEPLCASQQRLVFPRVGVRQDNTWMYIINQSNYTQGVRVEECMHTRSCNMASSFPLSYKAECKQKYIYRQLLAIDENGNTKKDLFRLPSCCQCVLIRSIRNN